MIISFFTFSNPQECGRRVLGLWTSQMGCFSAIFISLYSGWKNRKYVLLQWAKKLCFCSRGFKWYWYALCPIVVPHALLVFARHVRRVRTVYAVFSYTFLLPKTVCMWFLWHLKFSGSVSAQRKQKSNTKLKLCSCHLKSREWREWESL